MINLFKKRMNLNEIAVNLVGFAFDQNDVEKSMNELIFPINIHRVDMLMELMFLRAFAVDIAIYYALDDKKDELKLVSAKYRDLTIEMMSKSQIKTGFDSITKMIERTKYYSTAVSESISMINTQFSIDMLANKIGELFSEICSSTDSTEVSNFGSDIFKSVIGGVMAFIKSIKIKI